MTKAKTAFEWLADGPVRTESLRIARDLVKDELKHKGIKVSSVESSEITKVAISLLNSNPSIIKTAKRELARLARLAKFNSGERS